MAGSVVNAQDVSGAGTFDGTALGQDFVYVTVQAGVPGASYVTPIIKDTTAVSGATYAWDGTAYVKIANLVT